MSVAYKNFWALNTDEAVAVGILRGGTNKNIEVLMPLNAQMKDVDLILMNIKSKKSLTLQVKGSRAYEPRKSEVNKYGHGSTGWFFFSRDIINRSTADYFIFLVYVIEQSPQTGRRLIKPHTIIIPTKKIKTLAKSNKKVHGNNMYNFWFWVNYKKKVAFDFGNNTYFVSEYLDKRGLERLNRELGTA